MFFIRALVFSVLILVVCFSGVMIYTQYARCEQANHRLLALDQTYAIRLEERAKLERFCVGLETSPMIVERVAREKFNFSRDGELLVKYKESKSE